MDENRGDRVTLCTDGKYRWVYEFPMLKNPTLFFTVWKVLAISGLVPVFITVISDIGREGIHALLTGLKIYAIILLAAGVLSFISYLIVAAVYGWKYVVLFEMDEEGILHAQQDKQVSKAQVMGWLTAFAGAAAGSPQVTGAGLLSATHSSIRSTFDKVKSVHVLKSRNTIKLNEPFAKNQVYVPDEDFDFVREYISSRCINAVIK